MTEINKYLIEEKENSYGELLYRVRPPRGKKMIPLGWFKSKVEAIDAYERHAQN